MQDFKYFSFFWAQFDQPSNLILDVANLIPVLVEANYKIRLLIQTIELCIC